ncbi:calcium-binding protein [Cyanobium sp. HWJ4-Hawea]|uniref:calcium-binding protein n=1 Tax=Cyanobium sp. HWJ4-Hawea TaxID=2823713 RepID=UPI0020CF0035|nr:calcium-binding protein [Cyanobium sp. HWJ4-Hawea]MCP9809770.1 calcium-binding protein [Cyanobium sp. HWJ4-Hawea]
MATVFDLLNPSYVGGSASSDSLSASTSNTAIWGKQGNDILSTKTNQSPVFLIGGSGNDTYILDGLSSAIVAEYGTQDSSSDVVILRNIPARMGEKWNGSIIDNRHFFAYIGGSGDANMDVLILDFFGPGNGIEYVDFGSGGGGLTGQYSKDSLKSYIIAQGAPSRSWEQADSVDLDFYLNDHSILKSLIDETITRLKDFPDTPLPIYTVTPSATTLNEGSTLTTTVTTKGVTTGTTLYYSLSGTGISTADFSAGALTGSGTVGTDGKFTLSHTLANDLTTEGNETLQIKLFTDAALTLQVGSTASVVVTDSSLTPVKTYSISPSATTINEGSNLTTTVTTTGVTTGTTLYYSLSGTGITTADFSAGALTGSGTVGSNGIYAFSHTLASDLTTEGLETLQIKLYTDSARTVQVGATASVVIADSSLTPKTYAVTPSATTINEGATLTTTVTTKGVTTGTTLYYSLSGTGISTADFSAGALTGSGTVGSNGIYAFSHTLASDLTTEGLETLQIKLYTDSAFKNQVGTTTSVVVTDSSTDTFSSGATTTLASGYKNLVLTGTSAINATGNTLNNTITGNSGNNIIDGGAGADTLTGLGGADTFLLSTKPTFGASTADHITDFTASQGDSIRIGRSAFGIATNAGVSLTTAKNAGELNTALTSSNLFVYDSSNGNLYWNQNGSTGGFGSGGIFAVLDNKTALTASNINLY